MYTLTHTHKMLMSKQKQLKSNPQKKSNILCIFIIIITVTNDYDILHDKNDPNVDYEWTNAYKLRCWRMRIFSGVPFRHNLSPKTTN